MNKVIKKWWNLIKYEPDDPRLMAGGVIKIVAIGGGVGLSTLLRGLKKYSSHISAIVTMVDDGASSGRLRKEFNSLPPGDIRQSLTALSGDEELLTRLFQYRFDAGKGVKGHALGNLLIIALQKITGSFGEAVHQAGQLLKINGEVLPSTLNNIRVCARLENGRIINGQGLISHFGHESPIDRVYMEPRKIRANSDALRAIRGADLILIGPGSLFTSIMTNFLISGINKAVKENKKALKIYIANCSTELGETEHYSIDDHIVAFSKYNANNFDCCLVNTKVLRRAIYDVKLGEVNNITTRKTEIAGVKIFRADVVDKHKPLYHDPDKLAKVLIEIYNKERDGGKVT